MDSSPATELTSVWVTGQVLNAVEENAHYDQARKITAWRNEYSQQAFAKKKEQQNKEIQSTIIQSPFNSLPSTQQLLQKTQTNTIQTKVQQTADGLTFILYPEVPFSAKDVQDAEIEPISNDSIVIGIGQQRIGYRLPPPISTKQMPAWKR